MTKRELESLKELPVPAASSAAKRAAVAAAMSAFEKTQDEKSESSEETTKGADEVSRPTHQSQHNKVRAMRSSNMNYKMAASIAAIMIAAPAAFYVLQKPETLKESFGTVDSGLTQNSGRVQQQPAPPAPPQQSFDIARAPEPVTAAEKDAEAKSKSDKRVTLPIDINRKQLAERGADPATRRGLTNPTDGLGAVGGGGGGPSIAIGGGTPAQTEVAPPAVAAAPSPIDRNAQVGGALMKEELKRRELSAGISPQAADAVAPAKPAYNPYAWMGEVDEKKAYIEQEHRDKFESVAVNPVKQVAQEPVSTFSIDVDTASYAFVRRALNMGQLPPKDAVRVEEMINYFPYSYPAPETAETPFQPTITVMSSPWNAANQLIHVGIKGYDLKSAERPRANLVFLMDVSGSMQPAERLPLVKTAFKMLVDQLKPDDTVGIVTYASGSGVLLEPTKISDKQKILSAIDKLGAGGSTAGAQGIQDAYRLAEANLDKNAVNRVILATDGDFNVGITDQNELKGLIERKRQTGIFLSILGVGQGNLNDSLMQTLAQNGNGTAAHVDTLNEARKVLVDEASSTLFTIAKDVKIQLEFNPARVAEYRLVGYETRNLKREDFNNDKVDAGDIGSGHTVTAIYEVTPVGAPLMVDNLRYGKQQKEAAAGVTAPAATGDVKDQEFGFLKLRYKLPKEEASKLVTLAITPQLEKKNITEVSNDVRFSVAVAGFGQLLKGSQFTQSYSYDDVISLAQSAKGDDPFGYRAEFINMVRLAKSAQP